MMLIGEKHIYDLLLVEPGFVLPTSQFESAFLLIESLGFVAAVFMKSVPCLCLLLALEVLG